MAAAHSDALMLFGVTGEAAWAVVSPFLKIHHWVRPYSRDSLGAETGRGTHCFRRSLA